MTSPQSTLAFSCAKATVDTTCFKATFTTAAMAAAAAGATLDFWLRESPLVPFS